jgi:pentatricopeptide repeat protein
MFNTAILAAGKAGQLAVADALFGQARASSVADAATYEAMVAVYGMAGDHQRAEVVLRGMQAAGLSPGEYAYCGLIAAYSLAGDAAAALRVRGRMTKAGCQPGAHTYNALIAAADRAAMFDKALDFLRSMKREGVEANALTQQLAADIGRKGAATVEGQQLTAAALSAAMAAAGTLLMRSGVF